MLGFDNNFILLLGAVIFLIAFLKTDFALIILIFSMLLSPELEVGAIPARAIIIRADDIFLIVVFLGWLAKMAINKELGLIRSNPLNRVILIYILIYTLATIFGAMKGYLKLQSGVFYLLKYFEYFLLFFMVFNNIKNINQIRVFVFFMLLVSLIVSLYAWKLHLSGVGRVTAPFDTEGEANTLGGYLILIIMLVSALLFNLSSFSERIFLFICLFFAIPALLFTLSRGSWLGFIVAVVALFFLTPRRKVIISLFIVAGIMFLPIILPSYVKERIRTTFVQGRQYEVLGRRFKLDESASARIESWSQSYKRLMKEPFLGYGAGSVNVVDNQYSRVMIESGILGFLAFFWLMVEIFRNSLLSLMKLKDEPFACGLIAGFLAGFFGLLAHSLSAASFIIIRIMEPFWFLMALVIALPEVYAFEK